MEHVMLRNFAVIGCVALLTSGAGTAALARTPFDGLWHVVFVTERGDCDPSYRYGVRIANGTIVGDPSAAFAMAGRVARDGAIRGSIRAGGESASAAGRLSGGRGSGIWHSASSGCAGYWRAVRRWADF